MNLDQKMIISVLNSMKIMNVRFRGADVTDAIRDALRPLMKDVDDKCMRYIRLLREPETITTTTELANYRTLAKQIKVSPANLLLAKVGEVITFITERIQELEVVVVVVETRVVVRRTEEEETETEEEETETEETETEETETEETETEETETEETETEAEDDIINQPT